MSNLMQYQQALSAFNELTTEIPADDEVMLSEAWSNYTDSLCQDGEITSVQYNHWTLDDIEDDDDLIGWHLGKMGVTLTATFLPASEPTARDDMINHTVTLRRNDTDVMTTRYSQGIGHIPGPAPSFPNPTVWEQQIVDHAIEHGKGSFNPRHHSLVSMPKLPEPDLNDVMYSLLADIQSADLDFDDWAIEYGYDTDSRKAYAMWEECQHTARCFRRTFTADELEMLHTLLEDY